MPALYELSVIKVRRAILRCNQLGIGHSWHCGARWYSESIRWAGFNLYMLHMISECVSEVNFRKACDRSYVSMCGTSMYILNCGFVI